MNRLKLWFILSCGVVFAQKVDGEEYLQNQAPDVHRYNCYDNAYVNPPHFCSSPPVDPTRLMSVLETNPLLSALVLSSHLHLHPKIPGYNNIEHLPLNPYVALLLSHYGKYTPIYGKGRGLYGYVAANNYHNNKPFGSYKIFEDHDG